MKTALVSFLIFTGSFAFSQLSPVQTIGTSTYKIDEINGVKMIKAPKGKTFYQISKDTQIPMSSLRAFNEFDSYKDIVLEGEIIYIERKKNKSKKIASIVLKNRSTLRKISRNQAIRLSNLIKYNQQYSADQELSRGERIFLRP